ncbi:hypothetical protein K493DRAFT_310128 [Basidiobolus meristosporus CBS 931.73]|uniref:Uncharacterized protein n=1 Tax=Basidiobolus meristosporus CBS 931.73 TaxID=1314790 RepID=A0A1Y1ZBT6_9FUNG|nr:hypothetical protein K493DRAFT_310128 [Basidiobolus meristosporus CBS 931.73]|eukprot:ORY07584.1 hypothetical protein K493DRAFT_310128 [Basidiobolus meristosporus CBS 931.73]
MNFLPLSVRTFAITNTRLKVLPSASLALNRFKYSSISRVPATESEDHVIESAHHNFLSHVLQTSSDEDWASPGIQSHIQSSTPHTLNATAIDEQLWDDLVREN